MDSLVVLVIVLTLAFAFFNGFHDVSSTISSAMTSRALSPRWALAIATVFNFVGGLIGNGVAERFGGGIVEPPTDLGVLYLLLICGLIGALSWNLVTYFYALPMSSTHALLGGLLGAGFVLGAVAHQEVLFSGVILPLILSPLFGILIAWGLTWLVIRYFATTPSKWLFSKARSGQGVATAALSLAHGIQDAQKSTAVIMIAVTAAMSGSGAGADDHVISWPVRIAVALALAAGTWWGGWRIVRVLSENVTRTDPVRALMADTSAALMMYAAAFIFRVPVSLTYTVTSAIIGSALPNARRSVRFRYVAPVVACWVLSVPATAVISGVLALFMLPLV